MSTTTRPDLTRFALVPSALTESTRFVLWRYEERDGKQTKIPYQTNGVRADSTDPATWTTFSAALETYSAGGFDGIGIVLGNGYVGIDLDDCIAEGKLLPYALKIIDDLNTYTEISPSQTGVKLFLRGDALPTKEQRGRRKFIGNEQHSGDIEMYSESRFFTVTGAHFSGTPLAIESRSKEFHALYGELLAQTRKPKPTATRKQSAAAPDDQKIIDKLIADPKYARLWSGDYSDFGSQSEADLSLCGRIAFFVGNDRSRIDKIFRQSGLMRDKWDRADYSGATISKALDGKTEFHKWNGQAKTEKKTDAAQDDDEGPGSDVDRATELANAEALHRQYGAYFRYHVDRGEFYIWSGAHWAPDIDGQIVRWAKEIARSSSDRLRESVDARDCKTFQKLAESARGIAGVIKLAQTEPGVSVTADRFDRDDYLLNVANGTLDLRTQNLRPHDPGDLITHQLTTPYNPDARCNMWESVVHRAMDGNADLIAYLRRWCGLALSGVANVQELLIAYGIGANGKSVIFDTLCGLLESLAGVAPESLLIARHGQLEHPTEIADLLGKRLVVASETESGATLRIQLIKRLTGDVWIKGRFMRQDFFQFRRTHKMVLITNNKPRLTENSEAVGRRLRLLPFNVVIPPEERDPDLLQKLKPEYPGILAWCVQGFADYQQNGMNPPDEVLIATKEYRDDSDELAEFISAKCIIGDAAVYRASRANLHAAYLAWTRETNERHPLDRNALYDQIRRQDGVEDAPPWKSDGRVVRGFKGIAIVGTTPESCRQDL